MGSSEIRKIDFSGLEMRKAGTEEWVKVRVEVMDALETQGFFEAVYHDSTTVSRDKTLILEEELFGPVLKELYALPLDVKMVLNHSDRPDEAYTPRRPGCNFESLKVDDASSDCSLSNFSALLWPPNGNPTFCEVVRTYVGKMRELDMILRRMVVEALGVEKQYWESLEKSVVYGLSMTEYDAPVNQETIGTIGGHCDMNIITIIRQQEAQGLEMQTKDGGWLLANPNSFNVVIGESFQAWSNGRVNATPHRVKMLNNEKRHSIQFRSYFKDGCIIQAPNELVDQDHPQLYKPYNFPDYLKYLFSDGGFAENTDTLKAYCGTFEGEKINDGMKT